MTLTAGILTEHLPGTRLCPCTKHLPCMDSFKYFKNPVRQILCPFLGEETETQRGDVTSPRSRSQSQQRMGPTTTAPAEPGGDTSTLTAAELGAQTAAATSQPPGHLCEFLLFHHYPPILKIETQEPGGKHTAQHWLRVSCGAGLEPQHPQRTATSQLPWRRECHLSQAPCFLGKQPPGERSLLQGLEGGQDLAPAWPLHAVSQGSACGQHHPAPERSKQHR